MPLLVSSANRRGVDRHCSRAVAHQPGEVCWCYAKRKCERASRLARRPFHSFVVLGLRAEPRFVVGPSRFRLQERVILQPLNAVTRRGTGVPLARGSTGTSCVVPSARKRRGPIRASARAVNPISVRRCDRGVC